MIFVDVQARRHIGGYALVVAREHHGLVHPKLPQGCNGLPAVVFHLVGDDDMSGISTVHGHMDGSADDVPAFLAHYNLCPHGLHQSIIANADLMPVDRRTDALSGNLLYILQVAAVGKRIAGTGSALVVELHVLKRFLAECRPQGRGDGVGAVVLGMRGEVQQVLGTDGLGMDGRHHKHAFGQRACLVEDHRGQFDKGIHIVAAFDEYAFARSTADTAEEAQRHGDDQGARAAHHEEAQRPVDPRHEALLITVAEKGRDERYRDAQKDDNGRIDTGETADERLAFRLVLRRFLHEFDNL